MAFYRSLLGIASRDLRLLFSFFLFSQRPEPSHTALRHGIDKRPDALPPPGPLLFTAIGRFEKPLRSTIVAPS